MSGLGYPEVGLRTGFLPDSERETMHSNMDSPLAYCGAWGLPEHLGEKETVQQEEKKQADSLQGAVPCLTRPHPQPVQWKLIFLSNPSQASEMFCALQSILGPNGRCK